MSTNHYERKILPVYSVVNVLNLRIKTKKQFLYIIKITPLI